MMSGSATQQSYLQLIAVKPVLKRLAPLAELVPSLPPRTLFHAGPPFADPTSIPAPVQNAFAAAAIVEGWVDSAESALAAREVGDIRLRPAQDIGLVTPLAFVVGPSTYCVEVADADEPTHRRLAPLNDGPLPHALRFGTGSPEGIRLLKRLVCSVGPDLSRNLRKDTPLLPLLAAGLSGGDDLHGHVAVAQTAMPRLFEDTLSEYARAFISDANQFVLNIIMATAAAMIGGGAGVDGSALVVAAGGNGVDFGYKLAGAPDTWVTRPANRPIGTKFPGKEDMHALPAIGDSAVIDAVGFGAACLRFCPTLKDALTGHVDPIHFDEAAHDPFVGPHPALPFPRLRVGLDLTRPRNCLGIMLGMVGAAGTEGIVGRGVAPWPAT